MTGFSTSIASGLKLVSAAAFVLLLCSWLTSCEDFISFDSRINKGLIEYEVTFPYLEDENELMVNLLPDRMQMYFNRGAYVNELSTVGGLFKNRFLVDQQDKSMLHQLKVFKKKLESGYDENEVQRQLMTLPQLTIIETQSTDTIAGLVCKKAIGVFDNVSLPEMEIWYTQEINLENPNWCTQFHSLNGVLMQYEVEQLGIRMRFKAISVQNLDSVEDKLKPEPGYESVSVDELQIELEQLVSTFNF